MRKASRNQLAPTTIEEIIESARQTQGRSTTPAEREKSSTSLECSVNPRSEVVH